MSPHDVLVFEALAAIGAAALLGLAIAAWRLLMLAQAFAARWARAMQALELGARPLLGSLSSLAESAGEEARADGRPAGGSGWGVHQQGTLTCLPRNGAGLWAQLTRVLTAWLR